tara:strand:+ start:17418 stop:17915 length:498 start_codon:yes stop_codon:yes gene_type:complete
MEITQEYLLSILSYNPITGEVTWENPTSHRLKRGDRAGCVNGNGYRIITFQRNPFLEHRLIWLMLYGEWPEQIDHINQDKTDNRLSNLRNASSLENHRNLSISKRNTSGFTGVSWSKTYQHWVASISLNKKSVCLGCYTNKVDAINCRKEANEKYGFHPNHGMTQ